jgi:Big-like domain-containing protein
MNRIDNPAMKPLGLASRLAVLALSVCSLACPTRKVHYADGGAGGGGGGGGSGSSVADGNGGMGPPANGTGGGAGGSSGGGFSGARASGGGGAGGVAGIEPIGGNGGAAGTASSGGGGPGTGGHGTVSGGTGTGGSGGMAGSGTVGPGAGGTTGLNVVNVYPPDGQTGVTSDVQITITFSASMDENSVKLAYSSSTLLPGQVAFSWNSTGTTLTITPTSPLSYATGTDPSIAANSYSYGIGTGATDTEGHHLATAVSVNFSTLKRITTSIAATAVYEMDTSDPDGTTPRAMICNGAAQAGHFSDYVDDTVGLIYVTFSVPEPPAGLYGVESATLSAAQIAPYGPGDPYSLSGLTADQITYESPPTFADNAAVPIRSLGVFASNSTISMPSISAVATIQEAFTLVGHPLLFRFQFGALPSTNATATFPCMGWQLAWTYLTT